MACLGHIAINIDDVSAALFGFTAEAAGKVDVVVYAFAFLVSHGIGVHNLTVYLHCSVIYWHGKSVAFAQYNVSI